MKSKVEQAARSVALELADRTRKHAVGSVAVVGQDLDPLRLAADVMTGLAT